MAGLPLPVYGRGDNVRDWLYVEDHARALALIVQRGEARKAKDWPAADRIRAELTEMGVEVLDGPGGTATWRLKEGG